LSAQGRRQSLPSATAYALRYHIRAKCFIMMWYISLLMAPPIVSVIRISS
jgi:hypothetical protein